MIPSGVVQRYDVAAQYLLLHIHCYFPDHHQESPQSLEERISPIVSPSLLSIDDDSAHAKSTVQRPRESYNMVWSIWSYMLSAAVSLLVPFVLSRLSMGLRLARCPRTSMALAGCPAVLVCQVCQLTHL